jgi:hypothetical protein
MSEEPVELSPSRIRGGLALISLIFVAAVVLLFVVDDKLGKAIFFGVALTAIIRISLLVRWLRRRDDVTPTLA